MKKTIQLSTIIKIKAFLEKTIANWKEYIAKYNDTEMKISDALQNLEIAENELIQVKEVIQESNKLKHKDGKTNNYYIYRLSSLNSQKEFYSKLVITGSSQLTKAKVDEIVSKIDKEVNEIRQKLIEFNKKEINFEITPGLKQLGLDV